jgi:3-hydroxyisobutyrate dehydrogenase-like beta-hydroxyacid dehydrogenase
LIIGSSTGQGSSNDNRLSRLGKRKGQPMANSEPRAIGFIGLGVMGEPMCRNLARQDTWPMLAFDVSSEPLERLAAVGVTAAPSVAELGRQCWVIFLVLPSGRHVEAVSTELLPAVLPGTLIVDCGTSPVALTRSLAARFKAIGAGFADAPIARTRAAAEDGTLSMMVGADDGTFAYIKDVLSLMASDVTHCGPVGCGQIAKIMNNMVLMQTVVALSEAAAVARRAGLATDVLFDVLSKGSADSFALRNHGLKAILPGLFPERAFSVAYAQKDVSYALELAATVGVDVPGAKLASALLAAATEAGDGDKYWPVISRVVDAGGGRS